MARPRFPRRLPEPEALPALLVARQAAALLGLSQNGLRAATERGEIPGATIGEGATGKRIYRYSRQAILALRGEGPAADLQQIEEAAYRGTLKALREAFGRLGGEVAS